MYFPTISPALTSWGRRTRWRAGHTSVWYEISLIGNEQKWIENYRWYKSFYRRNSSKVVNRKIMIHMNYLRIYEPETNLMNREIMIQKGLCLLLHLLVSCEATPDMDGHLYKMNEEQHTRLGESLWNFRFHFSQCINWDFGAVYSKNESDRLIIPSSI